MSHKMERIFNSVFNFSRLLLFINIITIAMSAPTCSIGDPKFKNNENGYLNGIPITDNCPISDKNAKVKYIIPVENVDAAPPETKDNKIFSLGLYSPNEFQVDFENLTTFLSKHNIPSYVKFVVANDIDDLKNIDD